MARFQILCLSGGGYRGLFAAAVLNQLEQLAQKPIYQCFDLIAGTSIGGILALGLANDCPAERLEKMLKDHGPRIFSPKPVSRSAIVRGAELAGRFFFYPTRALYNPAALAHAVESEVGPDTKIGHLKRAVIVPTVNLSKGRPQVFKTPHHPTFVRDWRCLVKDVALATSAAPTFFPVHEIDNEMFADGGLYANSPDHLAFHEATHFLNADPDRIHVLSIGTASTAFSWSSSFGRNLGWFNWAYDQRLINAMMAAQQINTDAVLRHLLKERYFRVDAAPSLAQAEQIGLDVASPAASKDLLSMANAATREISGNPKLLEMLSHEAPSPRLYHGGS